MGWCQAFGPQIREGCDYSMVAGHDRCSCPECGVVCYGKFVGCTSVWAAGPQEVTLRRPSRESGGPRALAGPTGQPAAAGTALSALPAATGSNGSGTPTHAVSAVAAASAPPLSPTDVNDDLRPLLHAIRAEMQVLSRKVDQIQRPDRTTGEAAQIADRALAPTEALPGRIAKAVAQSLREQHKAMLLDIGAVRVQMAEDARAVEEAIHQPAVSGRIVSAFDARFEWLVSELSERFVTLGNEIARTNQHLAAFGLSAAAANGDAEQAPFILHEVSGLANQMDDIINLLRSRAAHQ